MDHCYLGSILLYCNDGVERVDAVRGGSNDPSTSDEPAPEAMVEVGGNLLR